MTEDLLKYFVDKAMEEITDECDIDFLNKITESMYPDDIVEQTKGKIDNLFSIKGDRIIKNLKERISWIQQR